MTELHMPLTLEQEWFFRRRIASGGAPMLVTRGFDIVGPLDVDRLLEALYAVIEQHQGMRATVNISEHGHPNLVIHPQATQRPLVLQAVTARSRGQFEAYARSAGRADMTSLWDPVRGPLYRLRLLRWSAKEHILLGTFDHLAFDDRAAELFFHYLWVGYSDPDGTASGTENTGTSIDLATSIKMERERYADRATSVNTEYWARLYAQIPEDPSSDRNHGQESEPEYECDNASLELNADSAADIRLAAARAEVSMFTAYAAVFAWTAFNHIRREKLAIYVPLDNRRPADRWVIGNFACVRPLVLYRGNGTVASYLEQVEGQLLRSLAHRHMDAATEHRLETGVGNALPKRGLAMNYMRSDGAEAMVLPETGLTLRRVYYAPKASTRSEKALALNVREESQVVGLSLRYAKGFLSAEEGDAVLSSCVAQLTRLSRRINKSQ